MNGLYEITLHHQTKLHYTWVTTHNSIEGKNSWQERASRRQKTKDKKMAFLAVPDALWEVTHRDRSWHAHRRREGNASKRLNNMLSYPWPHSISRGSCSLKTHSFPVWPKAPGAEIVLTCQVFMLEGSAYHKGVGRGKGREYVCRDTELKPLPQGPQP